MVKQLENPEACQLVLYFLCALNLIVKLNFQGEKMYRIVPSTVLGLNKVLVVLQLTHSNIVVFRPWIRASGGLLSAVFGKNLLLVGMPRKKRYHISSSLFQ